MTDRQTDRQTDRRTDGIAIAYARLAHMLSLAKREGKARKGRVSHNLVFVLIKLFFAVLERPLIQLLIQESLADAKVSARQQCVNEDP